MNHSRGIWLPLLALLLLLGGCATRPVNPQLKEVGANTGYTFQTRQKHFKSQETLVVLAFSGGGTRAAAFSYGVLEFLRRTEVVGPKGNKVRLLDAVDMITGVSGGSFTALAYGLYGDKLFVDYEQRFLKRDVQGELIARALNPFYWGKLSSTGWGRSELAAEFYDEILFNGATFGDLDRGDGPFIVASATDISTGGRVPFNQNVWNVLCADLNAVRLSRAAAASSAVPVVLSTITINNYGGTCNLEVPPWVKVFTQSGDPPRPAARAIRELQDVLPYADGAHRPYIHLVDGGVSDNLGMRGVLDALEFLEALHEKGIPTPLDEARRIIVFVVNSMSSPPTNWDESENPPGTMDILLKATGAPIDHYSFEAVEQLKDIAARWRTARELRKLAGCSTNKDLPVCAAIRPPEPEVYAIDVSFATLPDAKEREYLNLQPTSFVLPPEAVDRLRAAAGTIILASPEFQRLLKDFGATVVADPSAGAGATSSMHQSQHLWRQDEDALRNESCCPHSSPQRSVRGVAHGKECKGVNFPDQAQVDGTQPDAQRARLAPGDGLQGQRLRGRVVCGQDVERSERAAGRQYPGRTDPAVRAQRRRRRPAEGLERGIRKELQRPAACAEGAHRHAQRLDDRRQDGRQADVHSQARRRPGRECERRGEGNDQRR